MKICAITNNSFGNKINNSENRKYDSGFSVSRQNNVILPVYRLNADLFTPNLKSSDKSVNKKNNSQILTELNNIENILLPIKPIPYSYIAHKNILSKSTIVNRQPVVVLSKFDENGNLKCETTYLDYVDDKKILNSKYYYPNGKLRQELDVDYFSLDSKYFEMNNYNENGGRTSNLRYVAKDELLHILTINPENNHEKIHMISEFGEYKDVSLNSDYKITNEDILDFQRFIDSEKFGNLMEKYTTAFDNLT